MSTEVQEALTALKHAASARMRAENVFHQKRERLICAIMAALEAGARPTDVAAASGWTSVYVRRLARAKDAPE